MGAVESPAVSLRTLLSVLLAILVVGEGEVRVVEGAQPQWCIARSAAGATALQSALDYACGVGGADCVPIQSSGLCYLPNTLQAHTSYAFNSYFQRSNAAPGACDFGGTATVTITDPSYGSCTFPSSPSTAGASNGGTPAPPGTTNTPRNFPSFAPPPPSFDSSIGGINQGSSGLNPSFGPPLPNSDMSCAPPLLPFFLLSSFFYFLHLPF